MLMSLLLSVMMMAGLFLMLLGGVGFIQWYKFFSSAPKDVRAVVPKTKPERFRGQHVIGWAMIVISFALMGGAIILGALNGIENDYTFWQFYVRFFICIVK